jgi:hypothetical protein
LQEIMTDRDVARRADEHPIDTDHVDTSQPGHADTGTAAGVGGVTGAAIGAVAGPIGAALGAVGGMAVGAAAERAMHADDDAEAERRVTGHTQATDAPVIDAPPEPRPLPPVAAVDGDDPLP